MGACILLKKSTMCKERVYLRFLPPTFTKLVTWRTPVSGRHLWCRLAPVKKRIHPSQSGLLLSTTWIHTPSLTTLIFPVDNFKTYYWPHGYNILIYPALDLPETPPFFFSEKKDQHKSDLVCGFPSFTQLAAVARRDQANSFLATMVIQVMPALLATSVFFLLVNRKSWTVLSCRVPGPMYISSGRSRTTSWRHVSSNPNHENWGGPRQQCPGK